VEWVARGVIEVAQEHIVGQQCGGANDAQILLTGEEGALRRRVGETSSGSSHTADGAQKRRLLVSER
jgi:hypothetical protein